MPESAWLTGPDGRWSLNKDEFLIGREAPADLIVLLPLISRRHARISRSDLGYFLADLGSRNGTFVNGQAIGAEPHQLQGGDEIVLGGTATFYFHDPGETVSGPRLGRLKGIWINETTRAVWVDAKLVEPPLSLAQFTLLALLYERVGQTVSRTQIIAAVWSGEDSAGVSEEAVDGLIKRLRQAQPDHEYIEVVRGHGLRLIRPKP